VAVRAEIAGVLRKKNRVPRIRRERKAVTKKLFGKRKSCRSFASAIGDQISFQPFFPCPRCDTENKGACHLMFA
jgi:hypothetical protein